MIVEHFTGRKECSSIEELEEILEIRNVDRTNEFIITGEEYYPYLVITVRENYAVLNYLEDEGISYIAVGGTSELGAEGSTTFNSCSETEEMEMDNYYVLDFASAKKAAKEFFDNMRLPQNVEWEEL